MRIYPFCSMIEVKGLSKYFNNKLVVDQVSFHVEAGETLVLLGTSGSGKTTTLKMINRLIEPSSGQVLFNGKNIQEQKPEFLRRQIGYVIQNVGLFPHYTVWENIGLVPQLLKWSQKRIEERTCELLSMIGLPEEMATRYPHELSGGQQQRVGLARALAANPPVILLDEPFGALDPLTKRQIQTEFDQWDTLKDKTMVMVTHDVFEAITLADKIGLMNEGQIVQIGTPKELLFLPCNDFVRHFFDTQRFRLELQVIVLKEVVDQILTYPHDTRHQENDAIIIASENCSLLEVLEEMDKNNVDFVKAEVQKNKFRLDALLSREMLLKTFYQIKASSESG